eukprot:Hpha_TRINITY_DN15719_c1_g8::TRINITY_DN15719_c1_g8_i1::g.36773::m.36773
MPPRGAPVLGGSPPVGGGPWGRGAALSGGSTPLLLSGRLGSGGVVLRRCRGAVARGVREVLGDMLRDLAVPLVLTPRFVSSVRAKSAGSWSGLTVTTWSWSCISAVAPSRSGSVVRRCLGPVRLRPGGGRRGCAPPIVGGPARWAPLLELGLEVLSDRRVPLGLPLLLVLLPAHIHTGQSSRAPGGQLLLRATATEPLALGDSGCGDEPAHVAATGGVRLKRVHLGVGVKLLRLSQVHPPAKDLVVDSDLVDREMLPLVTWRLGGLFRSVHRFNLPDKFVKGRPSPGEAKLEVVLNARDLRPDMYHERHEPRPPPSLCLPSGDEGQ